MAISNSKGGGDDERRSSPGSGGGPGLGSIFANAAKSTPAQPVKATTEVVIKCRHCGAPQTEARVFVCRYCGKSLA